MSDVATQRQARLMTDQATIDRLQEFQMEVEFQLEAAMEAETLGYFSSEYARAIIGELADLIRACQTQGILGDKYQWFVGRAAFEWSEQANSTLTNAIVASYSTMDRQVEEMARAAAQRTISLVLFDVYQDVKYRRSRLKETI